MKMAKKLRDLLAEKKLYIAPGIYDGLSAKLVEQAGFSMVYASGGAIARSMGLPDLGLISFTQVTERLTQIVDVTALPVIADADTGYGNALNARHVIKAFEHAGVAAIHLEDQTFPKRCGHYEGKNVVAKHEFVQKIKAVRDIADPDLYLIARTDAIAAEGLQSALDRAHAYYEAGADMIFIEAPNSTEQIETIGKELRCPKLLNMFWGGKTPIVALESLHAWGYQLVIVPSDLQRASIQAMQTVLPAIKQYGHTESMKSHMISFAEREKIVGTEHYLAMGRQFAEE